jgi:outer membrane murein-binding lipoprotein Lpp
MMRGFLALSLILGARAFMERPVAKVVRLLNDMKAQLEKEAAEDDEVMEKMVCWCETNDKEKTLAISTNTAKIDQLGTAIEEYAAKGEQLAKEVKVLKEDVAENEQELNEATTMRDKDHAEFIQDEKEQLVSLEGVKNALSALSKSVALPQETLSAVQEALKRREESQRERVQSFLQMQTKVTAPASAEIIGILKQMKDDFENSLKESAAEEKSAQKAYNELKAAKDAELKAATEQSDAKEAQAAEAAENLAQSKTDLKNTKETLASDTEFLADLKKQCANMDAEFAARKKVRAEEMTAVGETIGILTSDESRDAFGKTGSFVQANFIQKHSHTNFMATETATMARARRTASKIVLSAALKTGSPQLSMLAGRMQSDVFDKVKVAIDELVVQLKKENKDEIKHRDYCIKELNQNARATDKAYHAQHRSQTKHDELDLLLKNGGDEIAAMQASVHETQIQMMKASEVRKTENEDFLVTVQDQRATQTILTKALDKLKSFYDKKSFIQQPGGFKEYKKSGGAGGVMGMIQGIIDESKAVEMDALGAEQSSQAAYEGFIKDSNKAITNLTKEITSKTEAVAKAEEEIASVKADLVASLGTLEDLNAYAAEVHTDCDYTLKNFDARQQARSTEIDALNQAKAIVSGAR